MEIDVSSVDFVVVIPVYRGVDETRQCLDSVISSMGKFLILVVNDFSPEIEIFDMLREYRNRGYIHLIENDCNIGFPASVNKAFSAFENVDVIVLNADTVVPSGCFEKLRDAATRVGSVGTVTPFTNNGSICTVGFVEDPGCPVGSDVGVIDSAAERINRGQVVEIPTGVGFCMLITRACLNAVGGFNSDIYGLGYGEESEFCRIAVEKGYVNILACDVFVYHHGRVSFGARDGLERQLNAEKIIQRRHPSYAADVMRWLRVDPAGSARVALVLELMAESKLPIVVHVTHNIGGGIEKHIRDLSMLGQGRGWSIIVRPNNKPNCVSLCFGYSDVVDRIEFDFPNDWPMMRDLLLQIGVGRIHFHHVKGISDEVIENLLSLGCQFFLTLHDHSIFHGSPALTDNDGVYAGIDANLDEYEFSSVEMAASILKLVSRVDKCIVPSRDMYFRLSGAFPGEDFEFHPHPDNLLNNFYYSPRYSSIDAACRMRVVCIGALGREKGAEIIREVAEYSACNGLPLEFHLIGAGHVPMGRHVHISGEYEDAMLPGLLEHLNPHVAWFPVTGMETWSYTLSAALRARLPVLASDIGPFPERLAGRPLSWIHGYREGAESWVEKIMYVRNELIHASSDFCSMRWGEEDDSFYRERYFDGINSHSELDLEVDKIALAQRHPSVFFDSSARAGWRGHILRFALRVRELRWLVFFFSLIPYSVQRNIKRVLSKEPLSRFRR